MYQSIAAVPIPTSGPLQLFLILGVGLLPNYFSPGMGLRRFPSWQTKKTPGHEDAFYSNKFTWCIHMVFLWDGLSVSLSLTIEE